MLNVDLNNDDDDDDDNDAEEKKNLVIVFLFNMQSLIIFKINERINYKKVIFTSGR